MCNTAYLIHTHTHTQIVMQKMTAQEHFVTDIVYCYHVVITWSWSGQIESMDGAEEELVLADYSHIIVPNHQKKWKLPVRL